jgi:hypothetical protein
LSCFLASKTTIEKSYTGAPTDLERELEHRDQLIKLLHEQIDQLKTENRRYWKQLEMHLSKED